MVGEGLIGSWWVADAYYVVFKDVSSYKWTGHTLTVWKNDALDYHSSLMNVVRADGSYAPGSGPYSYLPRNAQTWEYNTGDADPGRDRVGWNNLNRWVELPKTSVPAVWTVTGSDQQQVSRAFVTDPNCWRPGNPELRQGITYTSGTTPPNNYYMEFTVWYETRTRGWFGCIGNTSYVTWGQRLFHL